VADLTYVNEFEGQPEVADRFQEFIQQYLETVNNLEREGDYVVFDAPEQFIEQLSSLILQEGEGFTCETRPAGMDWEDADDDGLVDNYSFPEETW
jgi:hypothetical protein